MRDYVILSDSSCDLPADLAEKLGIEAVPLTVLLDGENYRNYLDERELRSKTFYDLIKSGKSASTSAVNVDEFTRAMEGYLKEEKDVLYLGFSSGLSATYQAGAIAAEDLRERYPAAKILTVDTLCASMGQGLMLYLAAQKKEAGMDIESLAAYVEENKLKLAQYFTVDDLHHLKRGGRISAAAAIFGSTLNIKPILHVSDEGKLVPVSKVRGRKQSLQKLADLFMERATDIEQQCVFISHGDCLEDAEVLADLIRAQAKVKEVVISYVGPVIGAHSGPGTVALFFMAQQR